MKGEILNEVCTEKYLDPDASRDMELQINRACFIGLISLYIVMVKNNILYKIDRPFFAAHCMSFRNTHNVIHGDKTSQFGEKKPQAHSKWNIYF